MRVDKTELGIGEATSLGAFVKACGKYIMISKDVKLKNEFKTAFVWHATKTHAEPKDYQKKKVNQKKKVMRILIAAIRNFFGTNCS